MNGEALALSNLAHAANGLRGQEIARLANGKTPVSARNAGHCRAAAGRCGYQSPTFIELTSHHILKAFSSAFPRNGTIDQARPFEPTDP
jgi:hypothetical protein